MVYVTGGSVQVLSCSLCFCLKTVVIKAETALNTVYVFACNKNKVFWVNVKKDLSKTRTGSWAVFHITFFSALIRFSILLNNVSPCHRWGSKIQLKAVRLLKTSSVSKLVLWRIFNLNINVKSLFNCVCSLILFSSFWYWKTWLHSLTGGAETGLL